ncbi:MAG: nucleotidyltransferase domain-containing protein [Fimbriimonadaceae bacterium]|nr:nucleotidyltransferase domain-containing protein [Fimbriimonadaceae bacterium]
MELPRSVWKVLNRAIAAGEPQRIVLYGSRARGTARPNSDFDVAFFGVRNFRG